MCVREREFLVGIFPVRVVYEQNKRGKSNCAAIRGVCDSLISCERFATLPFDVASKGCVVLGDSSC